MKREPKPKPAGERPSGRTRGAAAALDVISRELEPLSDLERRRVMRAATVFFQLDQPSQPQPPPTEEVPHASDE